MIEFILAALFLMGTPGPGVLSVAGTGAAYGFKDGLRYVFGLLIGNSGVAVLVITGIAAIVMSVPYLREVLLLLSVFYIGYLAYKIAASGAQIAFMKPPKPPSFWDGIALQFVNPKCYAVNASFYLGFALYDNIITEAIIKFIILTVIWIPLHLMWLWFGVTIRRLDLPEKTQRKINILMAIAMLLVVVLALLGLR